MAEEPTSSSSCNSSRSSSSSSSSKDEGESMSSSSSAASSSSSFPEGEEGDSPFTTRKDLESKAHWKRRRAVAKVKSKEKVNAMSREDFLVMVEQRKEKRERNDSWKRTPMEALPIFNPIVAVDLSWGEQLTNSEVRSLATQVSRITAAQKVAKRALHVHLVSYAGLAKKAFELHDGRQQWKVHWHEAPLLEVFDKTKITFLSPDATDVLERLDEDRIYVIGGIVDRDRMKGASYKWCQQHGVATARLPINESGALPPGVRMPNKSLNLNHVYEILCDFAHSGSWAQAIEPRLPSRKGFTRVDKPSTKRQRSSNQTNEAASSSSVVAPLEGEQQQTLDEVGQAQQSEANDDRAEEEVRRQEEEE